MEPEKIDDIIDRFGGRTGSLIQVLLALQRELNWLPPSVLERVSERLKVPLARVRQVATFYKAFSLAPRGRHQVHVCLGTACHVRGAPRLVQTIHDHTGLGPGQTDPQLKFTIETVNCLGCCALGPVVEIDGRTYGHVTSEKLPELLESCGRE